MAAAKLQNKTTKLQNKTAMLQGSAQILDHYQKRLPAEINLSLRGSYRKLLAALGNPHLHLPPIFHVAGTNGKGSTVAFLRAMLEAAGHTCHVYTSPHLVHFHERICIAGTLITEEKLSALLREAHAHAHDTDITYFEITTAIAFKAFAETPADFCLLEVGLGGRLDATNVIEKPIATGITRLSFDHCEFLGHRLEDIAGEKAGIIKNNVPLALYPVADQTALARLQDIAATKNAPLSLGGTDWHVRPHGDGFIYEDHEGTLMLPRPALYGDHQLWNAGMAITMLRQAPAQLHEEDIRRGLAKVDWPGRLQKLKHGPLIDLLPEGTELWLDGGHNDSAGEVLANVLDHWQEKEGAPPAMILGMIKTKHPDEFLAPLPGKISALIAVPVPDSGISHAPETIKNAAKKHGIEPSDTAPDLEKAISALLKNQKKPSKILIVGSLYLTGHILSTHR
jgi:dihydrofolate synthase / folylpolyglutamate synthase